MIFQILLDVSHPKRMTTVLWIMCKIQQLNTKFKAMQRLWFSLLSMKQAQLHLSFCKLILGETWIDISQQIFPAHRTIYFSHLLKTNFLSGPTKIYLQESSNINNRIKCRICSKLTIEAPDVILVSLLLTLNIFVTFFWCFLADFVNAG